MPKLQKLPDKGGLTLNNDNEGKRFYLWISCALPFWILWRHCAAAVPSLPQRFQLAMSWRHSKVINLNVISLLSGEICNLSFILNNSTSIFPQELRFYLKWGAWHVCGQRVWFTSSYRIINCNTYIVNFSEIVFFFFSLLIIYTLKFGTLQKAYLLELVF